MDADALPEQNPEPEEQLPEEQPPEEQPPEEQPPEEQLPEQQPPEEQAVVEQAAEEQTAEEAPQTETDVPAEATPKSTSKAQSKASSKSPSKSDSPPTTTAPPPPQRPQQDPLNTEFLYYSAVLRVLGPTLTHEADRRVIIPWVRKLFRPEYHSSKLKEKRNRFLAYLSTSLLTDETTGPFKVFPPDGALPELVTLATPQVQAAEWELDKCWQDTLMGLPEDFQMLECCVHANETECKGDHNLDQILDQEFQLYLYIARPYAYLLRNGNDRTRVASWFQMLCSIHGMESCSSMKAIRNDYMMALLGYLQDLRAVGPFIELPSWKTLPPLAESAKAASENHPITDPTGTEANEFLLGQPMPDDGAFCYIALTGDLVSTNLTTV